MSRQARPENQLTTAEAQEIRAVLGNQVLMSGLRKLWAEEAHFWHTRARAEALKPNQNASLLTQYATREAMAEEAEKILWKVVGG